MEQHTSFLGRRNERRLHRRSRFLPLIIAVLFVLSVATILFTVANPIVPDAEVAQRAIEGPLRTTAPGAVNFVGSITAVIVSVADER